MKLVPERAGPHDPLLTTAARVPGALRRTSSLDVNRPDGLEGSIHLDARARDLRTDADGRAVELAVASLVATLDRTTRSMVTATSDPPLARLAELVGIPVAGGFRARIAATIPEEVAARSLLHLLLDDLPGAELVSGYGLQVAGLYGVDAVTEESMGVMADVCAGWAVDATLFEVIRSDGVIATPMGPPAPTIERGDDPDGWHAMSTLGPHASRRRRCLDLGPTEDPELWTFAAHFRDSHVDGDLVETVVHEYTVEGTVDAASRTLVAAEATARVLPWVECPGAVPSAAGMSGTSLADLRTRVRHDLRGKHTCTHLNDTMRAIADLDVLLDAAATAG